MEKLSGAIIANEICQFERDRARELVDCRSGAVRYVLRAAGTAPFPAPVATAAADLNLAGALSRMSEKGRRITCQLRS